MARDQRATYRKRNAAARERKRNPARFCPRCSMRITRDNPLVNAANGDRHCALCEREITTGHIVIGLYAIGG
jgi:hypothetical protein